MIFPIPLGGLIAGLDNLQACTALGLVEMPSSRRMRLAAAFAVCETAAPMAGLLLGQAMLSLLTPYSRIVGPVLTMACAIAIVVLALSKKRGDGAIDDRPLFGLPVAL